MISPIVRPSRYHCLSISKAVNKAVPILLVGCFPNPVLERAVVTSGTLAKRRHKFLTMKSLL